TAPAIAASGVDLISAGWLTHSAQVLDIGLDWRHASSGAERSAA
ncbi:MAG TPA: nicotinate-nucleotide diphosphorylase (carboxylating), partial [Reyranella sp.]|nr:nicotinate-nucleotide diphosphorylase (carboxylating) [Reyranella sp.]